MTWTSISTAVPGTVYTAARRNAEVKGNLEDLNDRLNALGWTVVSKTSGDSPYTTDVDEHVNGDATSGPITVNLPAASGNAGKTIQVKKTDSSTNAITIDGNGSETINGAATKTISAQHTVLTLLCDGSNWHIV